MRGNPHVRFGGRAEETDPPKGGHRASVRSNHTAAALALATGMHPKVMSDCLGHSSIAITLDVYGHLVPGLQEDAAALVGALLDP